MPVELRARLLFFGIVFALVLRGLAILGGVALIERFDWVIYVLGVLLIVLAWRILQGVEEGVDPDKNVMVRLVRRVFPVTSDYHGNAWFHRESTTSCYATPLFVCLAAIVAADIAFAIDSIPAAFAITTRRVRHLDGQRLRPARPARAVRARRGADPALPLPRPDDRGRARARRRQAPRSRISSTSAPVGSLAIVLVAFAIGIIASLIADRREARAGAGVG